MCSLVFDKFDTFSNYRMVIVSDGKNKPSRPPTIDNVKRGPASGELYNDRGGKKGGDKGKNGSGSSGNR
jgi:hypothetical protein